MPHYKVHFPHLRQCIVKLYQIIIQSKNRVEKKQRDMTRCDITHCVMWWLILSQKCVLVALATDFILELVSPKKCSFCVIRKHYRVSIEFIFWCVIIFTQQRLSTCCTAPCGFFLKKIILQASQKLRIFLIFLDKEIISFLWCVWKNVCKWFYVIPDSSVAACIYILNKNNKNKTEWLMGKLVYKL